MCRTLVVVMVVVTLFSCAGVRNESPKIQIEQSQFEDLLSILATGWNTNDASLAASAFAADAVYSEPPDKQLYSGRQAIFEFFGGDTGRSTWMKMEWHNISFNHERQVGAGEFTFAWDGGQVHGMVSIKVENGLISRWREYFYESDLEWDHFQKHSQFGVGPR